MTKKQLKARIKRYQQWLDSGVDMWNHPLSDDSINYVKRQLKIDKRRLNETSTGG